MTANRESAQLWRTVSPYRLRAILIVLGFALFPQAFAHEGATGVVKERMELMSALGKTMKSLKKMIRDTGPIGSAILFHSAEIIRTHSTQMPALFPAGSYAKPSEALPVIEERRQEFDALFAQMGERAARLAILAEAPARPTLAAWFRDTGRVCSDCHKIYRGAR